MARQRDKIRRIFLSSTGRDLSKHRDAVYSAVNALGDWKCERMEEWPAETNTVCNVIAGKISNSDLFIGLVGDLYGSLCPSEGEKESYTRYEYDVARHFGKECLMYVVEDDVPLISWNLWESDELHSLQGRFRERIKNDGYVRLVKEPEEFAIGVVVAIRNWEKKPKDQDRRPAPAFQVPAPPKHILGREDKIQQAIESLHNGKNVLLHGMAGVGKSAVAYQVAHQLKGKKIYIDLTATSESEHATTSLDIKEKVIRALYPERVLTTTNQIEADLLARHTRQRSSFLTRTTTTMMY